MIQWNIEIDEYIQNEAAYYMTEQLGEIPAENEALFTGMRIHKKLRPRAAAEILEERSEAYFAVTTGDIPGSDRDSLPETYFLECWAAGYTQALIQEARIRVSEMLGDKYGLTEVKTLEAGTLSPEKRAEVRQALQDFEADARTVFGTIGLLSE